MAHVATFLSNYKTGSATTFPCVMFSPYEDWSKLCVRVKCVAGATIGIGSLVYMATAGTVGTVTIGANESVQIAGYIPDTLFNRRLIEEQNGASWAKFETYQFDANTYIDMLPLIPGFILSMCVAASNVLQPGSHVAPAASGFIKLLDVSANDEPACDLGRVVGVDNTSGTGTQYVAVAVR